MYNLIIRPLLFCIDPEKVHRMLLSWLKFYRYLFPVRACVRGYSRVSDPFSYGHLQFKNRIGLSAGFDKNAEAFDELADFGFGFLEVGTVTPDSQSGNPSPRIFRLVDDESLISRTGFNNCGVDAVRQHIRKYRKHSYVLGVNINKNPLSTGDQIVKDFESTFIHLYDCVDYFTLNWGSSVLSGISLDGKKYFYTNPLRISADLPYTLRWPKERTEYISCFCCPPNTLRTLCQAQNYAYTLSPEGIYCNLYGANTLTTTWKDKGELALTQETDYPWEGKVRVTLDRVPRKAGTFSLFLRIPEWCEKTTLTVNGQPLQTNTKANSYAEVNRTWKKGDVVELVMDMPVRLLEAHPLAEEIRNQVVVKRGPLVYCLESMDIANGEKIDNVLIPADIKLTPKKITIEGSPIVALEGMARLASATSWEGVLYRPVVQAEKTVNIRLIPYYAWGNRGKGEMTVWMPLAR